MLMNKGKGQASLNRGEKILNTSHLFTGRNCVLVPSGKVCSPVMKHIGHPYICLTCCLSETEVFIDIKCIKCAMIPLSITILNPRWEAVTCVEFFAEIYRLRKCCGITSLFQATVKFYHP